jgi:hypothetical protein
MADAGLVPGDFVVGASQASEVRHVTIISSRPRGRFGLPDCSFVR